MALVAPAIAPLAKGLPVATSHTAPKATATPQTEAPRSSAGEASAANLRTETARAIDAPGQSAVSPRLRDQETAERSNRLLAKNDRPTGPRPAFDESLLERRSRTAFDPPEFQTRKNRYRRPRNWIQMTLQRGPPRTCRHCRASPPMSLPRPKRDSQKRSFFQSLVSPELWMSEAELLG